MDEESQAGLGFGTLVKPPTPVGDPQSMGVAPGTIGGVSVRIPKTLEDITQEHAQWQAANPVGAPVDLSTYAQGMDQREGTNDRSVAYAQNQSMQGPTQLYNKGVNAALDATHLPEFGGIVGGGLGAMADEVFGTGTTIGDVGESIGHGAPRMMAPVLAGPAAPALMTADSMAQKYGETGDLAQTGLTGALTAGTLGLAHYGGQLGEKTIAEHLIKVFDKTGAPAALDALSTGVVPKLARTAGAVAGGVVGQEASHQAESLQQTGELANPLTVQNIASQVMSGAMMAGPDITSTYLNKSALNRGAQDRLATWANARAEQVMADRQVKPPLGYTNTDALIKQSIQHAEPGEDWRRSLVSSNLDSLSTETDPVQRAGILGRLTDAVLQSRSLGAVANTSEDLAKMTYIQPPSDVVGLTDIARRINTLKSDALSRLDEMAAGGDERAPSAAGYRQLEQAGFIKEPITLDWLKSRFGDNVERSLSNSNANGYLMLTQQLANEMLILSDSAKSARGESLRDQSVANPGLSSSLLDDRMRLANFFDSIVKVNDKPTREGLMDRYLYHEGEDNVRDTGNSSKFMDEITGVIQSMTQGKTPEEVAKIDWANTKGTTVRGTREVDPATGLDVRGTREQSVGLGDYTAKDSNNEYLRKVYGRANRSQKEVLASDLGRTRETLPLETDTKQDLASGIKTSGRTNPSEPVVETVPSNQAVTPSQGRDLTAASDTIRQHITNTPSDDLWRTIAPEFMNSYGRVDPRIEARLKPIAKDLVTAMFETGDKSKGGDPKALLSEAGQKVLKVLKPNYEPTSSSTPGGALAEAFRTMFMGREGGDLQARQGIIRRVAEKAGVEVPKALLVGRQSFPTNGPYEWVPHPQGKPNDFTEVYGRKGFDPTRPSESLGYVQFDDHYNQFTAGTIHGPKVKPLGQFDSQQEARRAVEDSLGHISRASMVTSTAGEQVPMGASGLGQPVFDAHRMFKNFFYRLGYEPDLAEHFTKLSMQTVLNFKNQDIAIAPLDQKAAYGALRASFDTLATAGMYGNPNITPTGKPIIGLALDHYAESSPKSLVAWHALSVLTHELVHDIQDQANAYDGLVPPTAYSKERVGAYTQLARMAEFYTPQQRFAFLRATADAVLPKGLLYTNKWLDKQDNVRSEMHPTIEGNLRYGAGLTSSGALSQTPSYEFVNTFAQVLGLGMLTGGNGRSLLPEEVYHWMPEEQQLFTKGIYRDLHDNLDALKTAVADPKFRESAGLSPLQGFATGSTSFLATQLDQLVKTTHRMVMGEEPARSAAQAASLASALDTGLFGKWSPQSTTISFTGEGAKIVKPAIDQIQGLLFEGMEPAPTTKEGSKVGGPVRPEGKQLTLAFPEDPKSPGPKQVNLSTFWRWGTLFQQGLEHLNKRGITLGNDVASTIREFVPAQNRVTLGLWQPFLQPGGKFDPSNPLVAMRQDKSVQGRADNNLLNKVMNWQQRKETEALEQQPDGTYKLTKKAAVDLGVTNLPQRVAGAVVKMSEVGLGLGQHLVESRVNSAANRTAKMLMTLQPPELGSLPWDKAQADALRLVRGMTYDQQGVAVQGLAPYPEPIHQAVLGMLNGGVIEALKDLNKQVQSRTWWMTEQRPGNYLVTSFKDGVRHVDGADNAIQAAKAKADLTSKGYDNVEVISRADKQKAQSFDAPENILQHFMDLEQVHFDNYLSTNPQQLTPEQVATIRAYAPSPGEATTQMLEKRGTNKFLIKRQSVPAAYGLDYTDNMRDYIGRLAATTTRQAINQKIELILGDDRMKGQEQFASYVHDNVRQMMTPSTEFERSAKAFTNAYFMAANLSSAFVIATHPINTVPETLLTSATTPGYGLGDAVKHSIQGVDDARRFGGKTMSREDQTLVKVAQGKVAAGQSLSADETKAYSFNKALQDKVLDAGLLQDIVSDHDADLRILAQKTFGIGQRMPEGSAGLLGDGLYRVSKAAMWIPRLAANFNNQAVFMAGLNQAIEQGLNVKDAFAHADKVRTLALFAGGKSNGPGWISAGGNDRTIPVFRVMHGLQQFGVGLYGRWADHISDSITSDPNLTSMQRVQALKAAGTMLVTQLGMAGVLGLPLVAASMALLEKKFGVNAEAATRQGVAHLAGADKDNSGFRGLLTELAMNGMPNQLMGVNIGPRLGVTDYMGTSAYDGFNLADLFGPAGSLVGNMFNGLGYAGQGNMQKAATTLLPNVFKRPVDMAMNKMKFGDYAFRDPTGQKLYDPSTGDLLRYAAGVNPSALSERQRMKRLVDVSNQQWVKSNSDAEDSRAYALVQGNPQPAYWWIQDQVSQGMLPPAHIPAAVRHLADKGLETQQTRDPLASGPVGNATDQRAIVQTFPRDDTQRQSETQLLMKRIPVEARAGVPKSDYTQEMARASVIDAMTARGMTRGEAERVAVMLGL